MLIPIITVNQNHVQSRQREVKNEVMVWYSIVWYDIVLFDVAWNEVFTDVGVHVVVFSDVASCRYVGVLTTLLRSVVPPSSESVLFTSV
jgi:hypothetical protein